MSAPSVTESIRSWAPHGEYASLEEANRAIAQKMIEAEPWLVDVRPAVEVMPVFHGRNLLLHAGPPIRWEEMAGPMRGAVLGAALFEGWARDEYEAGRQAESGEIEFLPCQEAGAVGPGAGIISPTMPVLVVEDRAHGNRGYCTLSEGTGSVLRSGAHGLDVLERLDWRRELLGPILGSAVRQAGGISLKPIASGAISMGDELHLRNVAAGALLVRDTAPWLAQVVGGARTLSRVLRYLGETEQFFLNVAMAYGKVVADAAASVSAGTVVTSMARNGVRFGLRMSGTGERWFTASVDVPRGVYFDDFTPEVAGPDMGDGSIVETIGWGGVAMGASPVVARSTGVGAPEAASRISREMAGIGVAENPGFPVPAMGFRGLPVGIDVLKVVETGMAPLINTAIVSREPGAGQMGTGTIRAPLECFEQALLAYWHQLNPRDTGDYTGYTG